MKVVGQRSALMHGVSIAAAVAPSRTTKAILTGIKLEAGKKAFEALATDLEISVRSRILEAIVEEPGEMVLTAQTLVEILRTVESEEVTIEGKGRHCEIRAADAEYKLVTDDPDEFPDLGAVVEGGVVLPRGFLEEMYQRVGFAAARDVGRYAINGVLIELGEGRMRLVATDGRRLAVATRDVPGLDQPLQKAIVPLKGLQEALRGSDGCESVRMLVDDERVAFSTERSDVAVKPVEGDFPDYGAVIPKEKKGHAKVQRDALLAAIRKASVFQADEMRAVRLELSEGRLTVSARVEGRGEAKTAVTAEVEGVDQFAVEYNPDFLIDYLKPLPSQLVSFEFRDPGGAGLFRLDGGEDVYVVMPITTS